jgi:hypothetical protein
MSAALHVGRTFHMIRLGNRFWIEEDDQLLVGRVDDEDEEEVVVFFVVVVCWVLVLPWEGVSSFNSVLSTTA